MAERPEYTLHANVNQHGDDVALRITLSAYDCQGAELHTETWRGRESRMPELETAEDTAWYLVLCLAKVMERAGSVGRVNAHVEPPLF